MWFGISRPNKTQQSTSTDTSKDTLKEIARLEHELGIRGHEVDCSICIRKETEDKMRDRRSRYITFLKETGREDEIEMGDYITETTYSGDVVFEHYTGDVVHIPDDFE